MGKRSTGFERMPRDYYPTPEAPVLPLLPYLDRGASFIEPCAGNGALVHILRAAGFRCSLAFDIEPKCDAVHQGDALDTDFTTLSKRWAADYIITNPPWSRPVLHQMIERFSDAFPTWLLFDADWVHTKQAIPYLPRLRTIVSVGRVKWRPETKMTGKDNCAWHLFWKPSDEGAVFYGRRAA